MESSLTTFRRKNLRLELFRPKTSVRNESTQ
jgi:hypothetical protein